MPRHSKTCERVLYPGNSDLNFPNINSVIISALLLGIISPEKQLEKFHILKKARN